MTRDEVLALSGRELSRAVYNHLILPKRPTTIEEARAQGWWPAAKDDDWDGLLPYSVRLIDDDVYPPEVVYYEAPLGWQPPYDAYASNIGMAWQIVERMREQWKADGIDRYWAFVAGPDDRWQAGIHEGQDAGDLTIAVVSAPTLPVAICRCALLALAEPVPLAPKTETV